MDSFNLLVGILLIFLAFQLQQDWIVFLIIAILIITMRSLVSSIILIGVGVFLYLFVSSGSLKEFYLPIIVVLIVVAVLSSLKSNKPQQPDLFGSDLYGALGNEGMGGYGGLGGLGG